MTLHILNGDATLRPFQESGIKGDIIIWREILSEGPVKDIPHEDFFQLRADYIFETFGEQPAKYKREVVDEFHKIMASSQYGNIYLWFEHDLVCQINCLFLLKTLSNSQFSPNPKITEHSRTIRIVKFYEDEDRKKKFTGFGALNGEQMVERFLHTITIHARLLDVASKCWDSYVINDPSEIKKLISSVPKEFPFLKDALRAHLKRFPSDFNGLNELQQRLLKIITENPAGRKEVTQKFLSEDHEYGTTDLLVEKMISDFQPELITGNEKIKLTTTGERILNGDLHFLSLEK